MGQNDAADKAMPQIIVHSLAEAVAALEAAQALAMTVTLVSPAGAAAVAGPAWFAALLGEARRAVPGASFRGVLDCADAAGYALAALRHGVPAIAFDGAPDAAAKLRDIAVQCGAEIIAVDFATALDLRGHSDAAAACRTWLAGRVTESSA